MPGKIAGKKTIDASMTPNLKSVIRAESVKRAAHHQDKRLGQPEASTDKVRLALKEYLERVLKLVCDKSDDRNIRVDKMLEAIFDEELQRTGAAESFFDVFGGRDQEEDDQQGQVQ